MSEIISKTCSSTRKYKIWKASDVKKETINFLQIIEYSASKEIAVQYLLSYEFVNTSFYMTQNRRLQKSPRSELETKVENLLRESCPATVPNFEESLKAMVVIDFMTYGRKMSTEKIDLIAYEYFFKLLWELFSGSSWWISLLIWTCSKVLSKLNKVVEENQSQLNQDFKQQTTSCDKIDKLR